MASIYYCSPTNSTIFTGCCDTAVCDDQKCCPSCGEEVWPEEPRARHEYCLKKQMGTAAYNRLKINLRKKYGV